MSDIQHTPTGRYIDFLGTLGQDPYAALDALGQHPPFWVDDPNDADGYWIVTRYDDVRDVLQDAATFSSRDSQIPLFAKMAEPLLPAEADPPYTQKLRSVLMPHMTATKIAALEPRMRSVCTEIIGGFLARGRCDAVEEFARVYPIKVFVEFFGLPVDRKEEFRRQASIFLHDADQRANAWAAIRQIVEKEILAKRQNAQNDLLSAIANARIDGKPLDLNVAVSLASTVFLGGLDTLPSVIGWSLRFLALNADYRRQIIARPDLISGAVEEFLRLYSVANPYRRVTRDLHFRGADFKAGDRVVVSIAASGREKSLFGDTANFERNSNPHLAFAAGAHRCLGSHLARHELGVALEIWHDLIPDYRVSADAQLRYQGPVFAIEGLPLEWDPPTRPI
jgi:cytochrome P450